MLPCPLPPAPTLDLLADPNHFIFSFALMAALASVGFVLPEKRRLGYRLAYFALGVGVLVVGYAIEFGMGQHWIAGLNAWHEGLRYGCYSPAVDDFVRQESDFAFMMEYVGLVISGGAAGIASYPALQQFMLWRRSRRLDSHASLR